MGRTPGTHNKDKFYAKDTYIAGESLDYTWTESEKAAFIKLVKNGATVRQLAKEFNRNIIEVYILLNDLIERRTVRVGREVLG